MHRALACAWALVRSHTNIYLLMELNAAGKLVSFVTSSPDTLHRGDTNVEPSSSSGSYEFELQVLPVTKRNKATVKTRPHDDRDSLGLSTENCSSSSSSSSSVKKAMSRVPLLVRSSPAQGTGKLRNTVWSATEAVRTRADTSRHFTLL